MDKKRKLFEFKPIIIITILIIIQLVVFILLLTRFQRHLNITASTWVIVTFLLVVYILNTDDPVDYKLAWMIPVVGLPIVGVTLYAILHIFSGQRLITARHTIQKLMSVPQLPQNDDVVENLKIKSKRTASLINYLYNKGNFPVYESTNVEYFSLGEDVFPVMLKELELAKDFIFMEYFIIEEGRMLNEILQVLGRKAAEGVKVRFMYDGTNAYSNDWKLKSRIEDLGIEVKEFAPVLPILSTYHNYRDHRKITVIDNKVAFTGGINLADEYINEVVRFGHWKDTSIRIEGDAVKTMTVLFLQLWNMGNDNHNDYAEFTKNIHSVPQDDPCFVIPYDDSPNDSETLGENVYIDFLNQSLNYVHIMTPYLILDEPLINALKYTAKRGVEVIILMPHIGDKDIPLMIARSYYQMLSKSGVKIYEYEPGFVHAKTFISDDVATVVGSINLDFRSLHLHYENAILVYNEKMAKEAEADFQASLSKSILMNKREYKKIPRSKRFLGKVLRMIGPLM